MKLYHIYKEETYLGVGLLISNSESGNCFTYIFYIQNRLIRVDSYVNEVLQYNEDDESFMVQESYPEETVLAEYISCPEWDEIINGADPINETINSLTF